MKISRLFDLARKESEKSNHIDYKLGCVIVKRSKILGTGHNVYKTHTKSPHPFRSIHAEFMAAMNAGFNIKGATVYVFRQYRNGVWAISKPCESCWKFLVDSGVKKIVYSCEGSFKEEVI